MFQRWILLTLATAALCAPNEGRPVIQKTPAGRTSASSGQEMYRAYCASCHGAGGKGDGPASAALKSRPLDLTGLAKQNAGKFRAGECGPEVQALGPDRAREAECRKIPRATRIWSDQRGSPCHRARVQRSEERRVWKEDTSR